ncbi:MAG: diaminopimelate decarboxylase [Planctomycetes bacterium]|nr:diaminopimelate decarboxylase [Planctomycetota bacterium]
MDHFKYKNGELFAEDVKVEKIIEAVGSPTYVYSQATFLDHITKIQAAYKDLDTTVCYAVKACGNIHILKLMADAGSGFDIVSGGELFRVQQAGGDMSKVMFAGVGKTDQEIIEALNAGIAYFNIESLAELDNLIRLAKAKNKTAKAALRVNPDVDYKTHAYITTGKKESKFGIDIQQAISVFDTYADNGSVALCGIHVHLGSGGKTIDPYVHAVEKLLPLIDTLRSKGHTVETLDLGGGYGAEYESGTVPCSEDYAQGLVPLLKNKDMRLILEPGKSICANAGILLTQVLYTKQGGSKKFAIVDAAMNDLIRPALYEAFHFIWPAQVTPDFVPVRRSKSLLFQDTQIVDVVGPVCESGDFLARDWPMPPIKRGDTLAVFTAGAYGFTMSSNYNARGRAAEVLVNGNDFNVISRRETYEDQIAREV